MGKMKEIVFKLSETRDHLFSNGINDLQFKRNCELLTELGFGDEVQCIIWEYENFLVNEGSAP